MEITTIRLRNEDHTYFVEIEVDGKWYMVIKDSHDSIDHFVSTLDLTTAELIRD